MAEKIVEGHKLRILIEGQPIAGAKECSLKITNDTEDVSNKDTGRGKTFILNRYEFTLSSSAVAITGVTESGEGAKTSFDTLMQACIEGTLLSFDFASTNTEVYTKYSGSCYIKDTDLGSPDYKAGTFSISLQGTGELTPLLMND